MKVRFNMVSETSSTTGTSDITLTGAKTPGQTFTGAGVAVADTFKYGIYHNSLNQWEIGIGTMLTSTTFSRSPFTSSNSNALVSFSAGGLTVELVLDSLDIGATGNATLDFGSTPGTNVVNVVVPDAGIIAGSNVHAWIQGNDSTATHNTVEHQMLPLGPISLSAISITPGVGFTLQAMTPLRVQGTFLARWTRN